MAFQSLTYLVFLTVVVGGCLAVHLGLVPLAPERARRVRNLWLLAAGYAFYGWFTHWWVILISLHTLVDFLCVTFIARTDDPARRRALLITSLVFSFLILATFKYFGFFVDNVTAGLGALGVSSAWLEANPVARFLLRAGLPAGISFFTFQSAGYVIDVFRRQVEPPRSLLDYAVFVSFFPQLVAGPIDRHGRLLRQVEAQPAPDPVRWRSGLLLICWGLVEKVVIADNAALLANKVFSLADPSFPVLWAGVACFGVQIYADFSGYTDMARGSARLLGFELMPNFNNPYLAQSPSDFWRRWHMTLSTWFRDYLFIPLGGSRGGTARTARNLLITFLLSGLWHGASWNFILWGLFHGVLVAGWPFLSRVAPVFGSAGGALGTGFRVLVTVVLMHIGWLLFREHTLSGIIRGLTLNPFDAPLAEWQIGLGLAAEAWIYGLPLLVILPLLKIRNALPAPDDPRLLTWKWTWFQTAALSLCLTAVIFLRCETGSDFIYFQF